MNGLKPGRFSELLVCFWYQIRGYTLVARNWIWKRGEIDLILTRDGVLVFVEVRARRVHGMVRPEASLGPRKRAALYRSIAYYLAYDGQDAGECRIEIASVMWRGIIPKVVSYQWRWDDPF